MLPVSLAWSGSVDQPTVRTRRPEDVLRFGAMWFTLHHMDTPTPERIRLTISVTPEVHEAFQRLSKASSMSIGRAMGEWLGDTLDAVIWTATKVEAAREAPKQVMREMHAYALGLTDQTSALLASMKGDKLGTLEGFEVPSPPSSNTGGKVPKDTGRRGKPGGVK